MSGSITQKPIRVSTDGTAGLSIMVPTDQLKRVHKLLEEYRVPFWVDHNAVSVDGAPALAVINIGPRTDPRQAQTLLDAAG